jgi:hypothetical protein
MICVGIVQSVGDFFYLTKDGVVIILKHVV